MILFGFKSDTSSIVELLCQDSIVGDFLKDWMRDKKITTSMLKNGVCPLQIDC
jgi:hypothetical protein